MGQVQKLVMGDDCGCQKLEPSSNDPLLCGCCDYHKHFHVRLENDIPNFGPYQKKRDGKYCGCQSYLGLQVTKYAFVVCIIKTSIRNNW
jgi:hypothetical protein